MAKIKVHYSEGYDTWMIKEPVIIDTDNYPELNGLSTEEIVQYLNENASNMKSTDGDEPDTYSLYDEAIEKDNIRVKETNNEVSFVVEFDDETI